MSPGKPSNCYNIYIVSILGLLRLPDGPRKTAALAAWIQGLYESRPPVLVGGAAVELYSGGAYTTGDLDFVGSVPESVGRSLTLAGFRREGRHWIHGKGELFVEFPGSAIEDHERTAILEVGGVSVLTLSPEDVIVDRLAAWQFWKSTTDGVSAFLVWKAQAARVDRSRLAALARRRGVSTALERLDAFTLELGDRVVAAEDLEKWANSAP